MKKEDDFCCNGECVQGRCCPRFAPLRPQQAVPTIVVGCMLLLVVLLLVAGLVRLFP